jgi:hypothetical protein
MLSLGSLMRVLRRASQSMQRCNDEAERNSTLVKFVQFRRPLADVIGVPAGEREVERQEAVKQLRERIEKCKATSTDDDMRIIVKPQSELWKTGVRAGKILGSTPLLNSTSDEDEDEEESNDETLAEPSLAREPIARCVCIRKVGPIRARS